MFRDTLISHRQARHISMSTCPHLIVFLVYITRYILNKWDEYQITAVFVWECDGLIYFYFGHCFLLKKIFQRDYNDEEITDNLEIVLKLINGLVL